MDRLAMVLICSLVMLGTFVAGIGLAVTTGLAFEKSADTAQGTWTALGICIAGAGLLTILIAGILLKIMLVHRRSH